MDRRGPVSRFINADRVAALVFLVVVALYGWEGARFSAALQVDVVGPAFFPKILTVTGLILGVLLLFGRPPDAERNREAAARAGTHLIALAPALLLLAYVLLLVPLGFPLATTAFLAVTFRYLGHPGWKGALLFAVAITAATFSLFHMVLEVRLPLGFLARLF